ncbi:AAA family ATPase [Klebsiella pneumoniae]|uniref:NERD domain-containing protein n=1 Tax=Klebsiella pneumoniae TaxID=573 RepID=UPI0010838D87|nr:NERD domain-containing protein/DEAD/DEAH box helicase [Klebsiella pneumoniae]MBD8432169.1 AAA family ATPase [Klebsiella pneumoniae]VGB03241.1 Superfamily I DNA and RNA helicases [Klebsiella pneumoniae]
MAKMKPDWNNISRLTVKPTEGELFLLKQLDDALDNSYEIFFNAYLDGDRPDIVILKRDYGSIIIEVKDWDLKHYSVTKENKWIVEGTAKRSPQAQVFRYKQNMFNLHLPVLGLKELKNRYFFNVIENYVYFHCSTDAEIQKLYISPTEELQVTINALHESRKNNQIEHERYERQRAYLSNKKAQLIRDYRMSFTRDSIDKLIKKVEKIKKNILFTYDIYQDFIRRLSPPVHTLEQGLAIQFDAKQKKLTESKQEKRKIKGVAGCGKTTIMAQRAINAYKRHNAPVLILTFNITLRHYIKDKISQIQNKGAGNHFEIMHYHGFINNKLNEYGFDIGELLKHYRGNESEKLEKLYSDRKIFEAVSIDEKYHTIFIDEIQDYEPDWIKNIRDNFLVENGEMVLFGDQSQNIYERDDKKRESAIVQGFGNWNKLTKSYRSNLDTPLVQLFKKFQESFLVNKYSDIEVFESTYVQGSMQFDLLKYDQYGCKVNATLLWRVIKVYIKENQINPNDLTIICSKVEPLIELEALIRKEEKTKIMFEDQEDLAQIQNLFGAERHKKIETIRRRKKCFFMQNSGVIKLSTIHSYKGLESATVFCILLEDDNEEMVYTGITRAKSNLVIFDCDGSKYSSFFHQNIQ